MEIADSVLELIGDTPLVRLHKVIGALDVQVLAKVEYLNPGGSVKDRIAVQMIDDAEASGMLKPGGTIVEPTSGNTGVGLALVAQQRGYRCVFVVPDKVSTDKISVLRAYGAEVVICPTAVAPEDPRSYYRVSDRLAKELDGGFKPDQYANPANPAAHYRTTGPELWRQTDGSITHFVAGVGTGGTITGAGRYLKEVSNGGVRVIGADPVGSVYSGGTGRPYLVEGVGEDLWPDTFDRTVCDEIVAVSDADSFEMTHRLAREEGLLVGGSCGMAVVAAIDVARRAKSGDVVVVLLPDSGRGYLTKVFNDEWLARYGFASSPSGLTVGDVLAEKSTSSMPSFLHTHPNETIRDAIDILREYGVSQLPVVKAEPPVMAAEVVGSVTERALLDALFSGSASLADSVEHHMSDVLPIVGLGEPIEAALGALKDADALVVLHDGMPIGVLTRQDLLGHISSVSPAGSVESMDDGAAFETLAIHAGQEADALTGAVVPPIYQVSTYRQDAVGETRGGHDDARSVNPTRTALESCLAALEGASRGFAFASGMAACDTVLRVLCKPGDHVVIPNDAYGGTFRLVDRILAPWGIDHSVVDISDAEAVAAAIRPATTVVWIESPTNPMLRIADLAKLGEVARAASASLVVDNTFATPYLQQPFTLGADVVVHSTTKYLGGHSDVIGGAALTCDDAIAERLKLHQASMGAIAGPFDAWLVLRGIRTLALRMDRHCDNAEAIAALLSAHPAVLEVRYPGLESHEGHELASRQMRRFGGMVSFRVRGGREAAVKLCDRARLFTLAESLGGVESLIEHPAEMTHQSVAGSALEVPDDLVRLSVGIEALEDLEEDLLQALG